MISGPLFQRVGDGHVRLSVPQFAKDAAQTKFANCYGFRQQFCEHRPSKPFLIACKEEGAMQQNII